MLRKIVVSVTLVSAALLLSGGFAGWLVLNRPAPEQRSAAIARLIVDGVTLRPQTVIEPIIGYGTAQADRQAWLSAEVSGEVVEISPRLRVGAAFSAGELLASIDDARYREAIERVRGLLAGTEAQLAMLAVEEQNTQRLLEVARAEQEIAERELQRVQALFEQRVSPPRELDLARAAAEAAKRQVWTLANQQALIPARRAAAQAAHQTHTADLALAEIDLQRCRLAAPFDGRLAAVEVERGERVQPGQKLIAILDPVQIEVPIELPVATRAHLEIGAPALLTVDNGTVHWRARVARIAPSANPQSRTFAIFLEVDNREQPQPLLPGMFVRARIDGPRLENVLLAPRGAIERDLVFVFEDGVVRRRPVEVAAQLLDRSVIAGLPPGSIVVTSNLDTLVDGAAVEIRPVDAPLAEELRPQPEVADQTAVPVSGS